MAWVSDGVGPRPSGRIAGRTAMGMVDQTESKDGSLEAVLRTAELSRRPARPPDFAAENRALGLLAQEMALRPANVLQKLVDLVLELCRADSAGLSILEPG